MLGQLFGWINGVVLELGKLIDDTATTPVLGSKRVDNPFNRVPEKRKFFMPTRKYSALFGAPGEIDHPTTISGRINLPVMPQFQAPQILKGMPKDSRIFSNPDGTPNMDYWLAYHSRKNRSYNWTYDDHQQLTEEHYTWKRAGIFNDNNGTVTYSGSRVPQMYD